MSYTNGLDNPELHHQTKTYTGNGSTNAITLDGSENMRPDWVWLKKTGSTGHHFLFDSVRGADKRMLLSDASTAESSPANYVASFDTDGFTLGSDSDINASSTSHVSWNWVAGGTAPAITYNVKVVSDSGNKYRFDDFGTSAVTLELQEGGTYTFDQSDSSNAGHPLRFSTTSNGTHGGGSEYTTGVTTTGTPGSSGAKTIITISASAPTLYYYCTQHSGMGGQANTNSTFGSSNFAGGIQSVASANVTSGFSIVTYTGTGSASSVGHNLGTTPSMVWIFKRDGTGGNGHVFHKALGSTSYLLHASNLATQTYAPVGIGTLTSSTFSVGSVSGVNGSSNTYFAYVFADTGNNFCKIGSYKGNGSSSTPTFIYTGMKPSWVMVKNISQADSWFLHDNKRDGFNDDNEYSRANETSADGSGINRIRLLSNGFSVPTTDKSHNVSGNVYIYMAFSESPFVNSNSVPNNAR